VADGICNDCGTALVGEYCHRCGQREVDDWRSLGSIARQFWNELVSFDYETVRSVAALLRPGYLAAEFIAGRRNRYLSPLKLYFLTAALFFVIAPRVMDFTFERQMALDRDGQFRRVVDARMAESHMTPELFAERFNAKLQTIYTLTPIFSVLSATLILRMLFGRRFPRLGPHTVFALYHVAFMFLVLLVVHGVNEAFHGPGSNVLLAIQSAIVVPYMFVALRRVYGEPPGRTFAKALALLVVTLVIDAPINKSAELLTVALT
jgi:Protein of unknown function (DUF3667)